MQALGNGSMAGLMATGRFLDRIQALWNDDRRRTGSFQLRRLLSRPDWGHRYPRPEPVIEVRSFLHRCFGDD